jgi:magnesium-transporting ATPase (P-type)
VGIFGKEGRQAANNADFAIGQFKFLKRLLLVHGRWNYVRQSKVFLYSMHKNMVLALTLFYFSYLAALSGTSMYQSWIYSVYNFALGLPICFFGVMNQDISAEFAMAYPQVYSTGLTNSQLDIKVVIMWIWNAVLYAALLCTLVFTVMGQTYEEHDLYLMGTMTYMSLVLSLHLKVAFIHHTINQVHFWSMFISVTGIFLFLYVNNLFDNMELATDYDLYFIVNKMYEENVFWFYNVFSIPLIMLMIDLIGHSFYVVFKPTREMLYTEASAAYQPTGTEESMWSQSQSQSQGRQHAHTVL